MRYSTGLLAAGLLGIAGVAGADGVTATVTASSDYDFRGITQSAKDPALAISVDYAHDSGFYAGIWGSNIDFGGFYNEDLEIDYYAGYGWGSEDGPAWNAFMVYYTYPSTGTVVDSVTANFPEANFGVTYKWLNAKVWYSWDFANSDEDAYYIDTSGTFALPQDFSLVVHAGYSGGDYWASSEYYDYSIGVTKTIGHFNLGLKFIDGSDLDDLDDFDVPPTPGLDHDIFSTDAKAYFSISTTFPWSTE